MLGSLLAGRSRRMLEGNHRKWGGGLGLLSSQFSGAPWLHFCLLLVFDQLQCHTEHAPVTSSSGPFLSRSLPICSIHMLTPRISVLHFDRVGLSSSSLFQLMPRQLVEPLGFGQVLNKNSEPSMSVMEDKVVTAGLGLRLLT